LKATNFSYDEIKNLSIETLGEAKIDSPLNLERNLYVRDEDKIIAFVEKKDLDKYLQMGKTIPVFEEAGPREKIFFDPKKITCGIVTCGGLCPGLNDVVRTITLGLIWQHKVKKENRSSRTKASIKGLMRIRIYLALMLSLIGTDPSCGIPAVLMISSACA